MRADVSGIVTWNRCSCTTPQAPGSCSTLCNGLPKRFPSGWTLRTGYTQHALQGETTLSVNTSAVLTHQIQLTLESA